VAKRKNKKVKRTYNEYEDYQDMNKGGQRKQQRKNQRRNEKKYLNDVVRGDIDPDDYQDYMEAGW
tara:strand:- start:248 stop:442 length:195 start_codon:yes stop_codon:yes gene_type:complete